MLNIYEAQDINKRRSILVISAFIVFVVGVVWAIGRIFDYGWESILLALFFSILTSLGSWWWGDKLILAISNAKPASKDEYFTLYTVTENLAMASQIPMPKLYVIEDSAPNAFATGRDPQHGVICVTTGLLEKLERTELEGVIAHEISHIKNYDTRLMMIVTVLVGMISLLGDWFLRGLRIKDDNREERGIGSLMFLVGIVLIMFSPLIAQLMKLALSRRREFLADSSAAMLTRYPEGLARALEKIALDPEPLESANRATAHLYIVNPFKNGGKGAKWLAGLFNTHPPVEERIRILREMT